MDKKQNRLEKQIDFLKEIDKYKSIDRQIYLSSGKKETDAEHAWHLAMFVILFEKDFSGLNFSKMLKMALVHDLVEIYAGDIFSFDTRGRKGKKEREEKAAKKLFKQLPPDLRTEFSNLFNEYENRKTKEARIVQSFDKIQPILQGILSHGKMWQEKGITKQHIEDYKKQYIENDVKILTLYQNLLDEAQRKKIFGKDKS